MNNNLKQPPQAIIRLYSVAFRCIELSDLLKPANDNHEQISLQLETANDNGAEN